MLRNKIKELEDKGCGADLGEAGLQHVDTDEGGQQKPPLTIGKREDKAQQDHNSCEDKCVSESKKADRSCCESFWEEDQTLDGEDQILN